LKGRPKRGEKKKKRQMRVSPTRGNMDNGKRPVK